MNIYGISILNIYMEFSIIIKAVYVEFPLDFISILYKNFILMIYEVGNFNN